MKAVVFVGMAAVGLVGGGCGGQAGATSPSRPDGMSSILSTGSGSGQEYDPLSVGASWTYQVTTGTGVVGQYHTTVEAMDQSPSAGKPSFRIRYELPEGVKLQWDVPNGSSVIRYEEQTLDASGNLTASRVYSPSALVVDESAQHLVAGATWTEMYGQVKTPSKKGKMTQETVNWTVQAVGESVTVPAGTFSCLKLQRIHSSSNNPTPEVTWYAPGVGKVKETGAGSSNDEMLELVSMP
jgi:hypothetical protein